MKSFKKIVSLFLALVMLVAFASCGTAADRDWAMVMIFCMASGSRKSPVSFSSRLSMLALQPAHKLLGLRGREQLRQGFAKLLSVTGRGLRHGLLHAGGVIFLQICQ